MSLKAELQASVQRFQGEREERVRTMAWDAQMAVDTAARASALRGRSSTAFDVRHVRGFSNLEQDDRLAVRDRVIKWAHQQGLICGVHPLNPDVLEISWP